MNPGTPVLVRLPPDVPGWSRPPGASWRGRVVFVSGDSVDVQDEAGDVEPVDIEYVTAAMAAEESEMASKNLVLIGQDTVWALNIHGNVEHLIDSARSFLTFEGDEWERLIEDGRTGDRRNADTFHIVECSDALAALVELHGGQVGFRLVDVDGPAVTVDEYDAAKDAPAYTLHFLDRDAEGNEHNGGEPMGVDDIDEAANACYERGSRGELFDGERKVAIIEAAGGHHYRWM